MTRHSVVIYLRYKKLFPTYTIIYRIYNTLGEKYIDMKININKNANININNVYKIYFLPSLCHR